MEQTVSLPDLAISAQVLLSTRLDREGTVDLRSLKLRADEGCVVALAQ
jgi:hypothetical protein